MWKTFMRKLSVITLDYSHAVLKPTQSELLQFENSFCLQLPTAYKAFVAECGPGEFNLDLDLISINWKQELRSVDDHKAGQECEGAR